MKPLCKSWKPGNSSQEAFCNLSPTPPPPFAPLSNGETFEKTGCFPPLSSVLSVSVWRINVQNFCICSERKQSAPVLLHNSKNLTEQCEGWGMHALCLPEGCTENGLFVVSEPQLLAMISWGSPEEWGLEVKGRALEIWLAKAETLKWQNPSGRSPVLMNESYTRASKPPGRWWPINQMSFVFLCAFLVPKVSQLPACFEKIDMVKSQH